MIMYNGKIYALTLSLIIQWGILYHFIYSLLRTINALRPYGTQDNLNYEKSEERKEIISG